MMAREVFLVAKDTLKDAGIAEPDAKAKVIVAHALGSGLAQAPGKQVLAQAQSDDITDMVRRCAAGQPVEYATGKAYFRYAVLDVTSDVLIPRNETELVAGQAIDMIREQGYTSALDMCTGSGCIAVSLATETNAAVDACDISKTALAVAQRNAKINNAEVRFFESDMLDGVTGTYDIIVCNPPYVSDEEYAGLPRSVRLYEPKGALVADDGLKFYRIIAGSTGQYLKQGGALVLEIGASQAQAVAKLLTKAGFADVTYKKDYTGRDRIVVARKG